MILTIPLSDYQALDKPIWPYSKGQCSVNSGYRSLQTFADHDIDYRLMEVALEY